MKVQKYLFAIATAMLLSVDLISVWAAPCSMASYDSKTASVALPCVQAGEASLSFSLDLVTPEAVGATAGLFWTLGEFGNSSCQPITGQCAIIDENFDFIIPIEGVIKGVKHVAMLKYYPAPDSLGFYWQHEANQTLEKDNTVIMKPGTPNPKGSFESLYILEGNFAKDFNKVKDVMTLAEEATVPQPQLKVGDEMTLRIFHFNDLHNRLTDFDSTKGDTHPMSQMVKIVNEAKNRAADNEVVLFMSAAEDHVGGIFDELWGYDVEGFKIDPSYHAYSEAGVDITVIGEHELDRGTELLAKSIETNAKFPILSANLLGSQYLTSDQHYYPAIIGVAKGLRIGLIGLTTTRQIFTSQELDPAFEAGDPLTTLKNLLPYVEKLADVIIILSHVGYNGEGISDADRWELEVGDKDFAQAAAALTDKPVLIVGSHLHIPLNKNGLETIETTIPILQAGELGKYLGEATLSVLNTPSGLRSQTVARLIPLKKRDDTVAVDDPDYAQYEHDEDLDLEFENRVMQSLYAMLEDRMEEVIGVAGQSEEMTTEKTIVDRYTGESAIANFMNDAIVTRSSRFPEGPDGRSQKLDLAVFNATGISAGLEPDQEVTFNDWYNVMFFSDHILVTDMTGAQIKEMVVNNAKRIVRPDELPEQGGDRDPTSYISRGFLHFSSGLRYTIKLGQDVTETTVLEITLNGQEIDEVLEQTFKVGFPTFIALGNEGWKGEAIGAGISEIGFDLTTFSMIDTNLIYRNENIAFIKKTGLVDAAKDGRLQVVE